MRIDAFGLCLKRVEADDLEMLRGWRNDPKIRNNMFFREEITPDMQYRWFQTIQTQDNYYFIILHRQEPVGLIHLSSINSVDLTAYAGLFIYDDSYLLSDIPARASLAMLHVFLSGRGLREVYAKVRGENTTAHHYNLSLGFHRVKTIEHGAGYEYLLTISEFEKRTAALRSFCARTYGGRITVDLDADTMDNLPGKDQPHVQPEINWIIPVSASENPAS